MKKALIVLALLCAAPAEAQEPKRWTNADLERPLPQLGRQPDLAVLAAMKARAERIPLGTLGGRSSASMPALQAPPAAPAARPSLQSWQPWQAPYVAAQQPLPGISFASQPLYPFVALLGLPNGSIYAPPRRQRCPEPRR